LSLTPSGPISKNNIVQNSSCYFVSAAYKSRQIKTQNEAAFDLPSPYNSTSNGEKLGVKWQDAISGKAARRRFLPTPDFLRKNSRSYF
jgi:hypothetical protein